MLKKRRESDTRHHEHLRLPVSITVYILEICYFEFRYLAEVQYLQLGMVSTRLFTRSVHITPGSTVLNLLGLQFLACDTPYHT